MKYIVSIFVICALALSMNSCIGAGVISDISLQEDNKFPVLTGIDLHGTERVIPDSFSGDLKLVVIGFEREHQTPINSWIAFFEEISEQYPQLSLYEVPLIYEVGTLYRTWINNGMRAGIPDDKARERTITVYTNRDQFVKAMNMQEDRIYALLLDSEDRIVWRNEGPVDAQNKALLMGALQRQRALMHGHGG